MATFDVATAVGYGDRLAQHQLRLVSWKAVTKGSLRGFATIEISPLDLKVHDCVLHVSHGKAWAALPGRPQIDKDGRHRRDVNGKPAYAPIIEWTSRERRDRFSAAVVQLVVRRSHPEAFGE